MEFKTDLNKREIAQIRLWEIAEWGIDLTTAPENILASCGAFEGKNEWMVGGALLVRNDLPARVEINPWLASVYVDPDFRNMNAATNLVQLIFEEAKKQNFHEIYCFTYHSQTIYTRLGFKLFESMMYKNQPITILRKQII